MELISLSVSRVPLSMIREILHNPTRKGGRHEILPVSRRDGSLLLFDNVAETGKQYGRCHDSDSCSRIQ